MNKKILKINLCLIMLFIFISCTAQVFAAGRFFKPEKAEGLYGMMLAVCVTELIAVYLLHRSGVMIEGKRMMLYLWPYFVIGQFIFRKKDAKVDEKTVDRA